MTVAVEQLREFRLARQQAILAEMSAADAAGVRRCADRLESVLPKRNPSDNVVFVAYGGGKDSSYTLAFVRALQLDQFARRGNTFTLRAATNRISGMPSAVMRNIDRTYRALGITEDPACEALLIDGPEIKPFRVDEPLPPAVTARNRTDLLMSGHRTFGEGRPTFCNACNLSMVNAFGLAAAHEPAADVVITGDSTAEQRSYQLWVRRLAARLAPDAHRRPAAGFGGFLQATDAIARAYFTDLYGPSAVAEIDERRITDTAPAELRFFSIFEDTAYSAGDHWNLLKGLLDFHFDEIAFSFTESDCGNPTLMAHLRGLKCERLHGRNYAEGLAEYTAFAQSLMRDKEFPDALIEMMRARYAGDHAAERMRARANAFAHEAYGLAEEQLVCLVHSPFTDGGARLGRYLRAERPDLTEHDRAIHALLAGSDPVATGTRDLVATLESLSGLDLRWLRILYRSEGIRLPLAGPGGNLVAAIIDGDPHKAVIDTRHSPDGPIVREVISGR
jgi:hypothetical protein